MSKKKMFLIGGGALLAVLAIIVVVVFQPQRLFLDDVVNEERPEAFIPTAAPNTTQPSVSIPDPLGETLEGAPGESTPPQTQSPVEQLNLKGDFISLGNYTTTGTAEVIPVSPTENILRLENFSTTNGPDLFVFLTKQETPDAPFSKDDPHVDLGRLKGNVGGQNYEIPADVDLSEYKTVLIYCYRFSSPFGAATFNS